MLRKGLFRAVLTIVLAGDGLSSVECKTSISKSNAG